MCNSTSSPTFEQAISNMQHDVQFNYLMDTIQDAGRRAFFLSEYLDACQIEDEDRRNKRKAAVIIAMYGER